MKKYAFDPSALQRLKALLATPKKVAIVTHFNPDGDAVGSSLGLGNLLRSLGYQVTVITPNPMVKTFTWMKHAKDVLAFSTQGEATKKALNEADVLFCLDFNTIRQIRDMADAVLASTMPKVMIDHHLQPDDFCELVFSFPAAASTCELVYEIAAEMGWDTQIDTEIAEALYCGIITDTGNFRFGSVTPRVHEVAGALIGKGANQAKIYERIYENGSLNALKLQGYVMLEKIELIRDGAIAVTSLTLAEQKRFSASKAETDDIVNIAMKVSGVRMSVFFYEIDTGVRVSLRSKGEISVREFAATYYGGGGHFNASAGNSDRNITDSIAHFKELAQNIDITK